MQATHTASTFQKLLRCPRFAPLFDYTDLFLDYYFNAMLDFASVCKFFTCSISSHSGTDGEPASTRCCVTLIREVVSKFDSNKRVKSIGF
jgi:hypothetical protein